MRGADAHEAFESSGFDFIDTARHADTIDSVDLGALRNEPTSPICTRWGGRGVAEAARRAGGNSFCEPSSAAAPAALAGFLENGHINDDDVVVVVISGSGFREIGVLPSEPVIKLRADALAEDVDRALTSH